MAADEPGETKPGTGPARSMELLWGSRERPSRGPKPKLSLERIAWAAIGIADAEGLDAVSMQRVASELGYTTMSLYRYVPGKDQLVDVMMDLAHGPPPPPEPGIGWRAAVRQWARDIWAGYQRHPWTTLVRVEGPPLGPNQLAWFEALLRPLTELGLDDGELIAAAMWVSVSVGGLARVSVGMAEAHQHSGITGEQAEREVADAMRQVVAPDRFPVLSGIVERDTFEPVADSYADVVPDLEFGLERLLDGLEAYAAQRRE